MYYNKDMHNIIPKNTRYHTNILYLYAIYCDHIEYTKNIYLNKILFSYILRMNIEYSKLCITVTENIEITSNILKTSLKYLVIYLYIVYFQNNIETEPPLFSIKHYIFYYSIKHYIFI